MAADRKRETSMTRGHMALYHTLLLGVMFLVWHLLTNPLLVSEEFARNTAFFFGKPWHAYHWFDRVFILFINKISSIVLYLVLI